MKNIDHYKARVLFVLSHHVGEHNVIDAGRLYELVFEKAWKNKINDTRALRTAITVLRNEGVPIGSRPSSTGGGYWLIGVGSEMTDYIERQQRRALKILARVSKMKKLPLPELLGQMQFNLEAKHGAKGQGELFT